MKTRTLKVSAFIKPSKWGRPGKISPSLKLQGDWMTEAGIIPGMLVNLEVSQNQIIIKL